jgi:hypothetical protein
LNPALTDLLRSNKGEVWFHVEMNDGVFARRLDDNVGVIQLRCSVESDKKDFIDALKKQQNVDQGDHFCGTPLDKWDTFYAVRRILTKRDLVFNILEQKLTAFARQFGSFV